jgi:hypothetical protein
VTSSVVSGTMDELVSDTSAEAVELRLVAVDGSELELVPDDVVGSVVDGSALGVTSEVAASVDSGMTELDSAVMTSVLEMVALKVDSEVGSSSWAVVVMTAVVCSGVPVRAVLVVGTSDVIGTSDVDGISSCGVEVD